MNYGLIFDRTAEDCSSAENILKTKIQKFISLTSDEEAVVKRGLFSLDTLTRIEFTIASLKERLDELGYYGSADGRQWSGSDWFYGVDFADMIERAEKPKKAFFERYGTPKKPTAIVDYKTLNDIEKMLYDIDYMIQDVESHILECGTFECGEF